MTIQQKTASILAKTAELQKAISDTHSTLTKQIGQAYKNLLDLDKVPNGFKSVVTHALSRLALANKYIEQLVEGCDTTDDVNGEVDA